METVLERFQSEAASAGPARVGRKFSAAAVSLGLEHAKARRASGASLEAVAGELGIAVNTLQRWLQREPVAAEGTGFRPVVVREGARGLALVAPGGWRIEGLDVDTVVAVLRRLS